MCELDGKIFFSYLCRDLYVLHYGNLHCVFSKQMVRLKKRVISFL